MENIKQKIKEANERAIRKVLEADPYLVDTKPASEVIPGIKDYLLLHAAPNIEWDRMCNPQKGAAIGACLFEGWAKTPEEAMKLCEDGKVTFDSAHNHQSLCAAGHMLSPSQMVFVIENRKHGNKVYIHIQESRYVALRYGVYTQEVIDNLKRARDILMPAFGVALRKADGIDLIKFIAESLHMGDEGHNRNVASTGLLQRQLMPHMFKGRLDYKLIELMANFFEQEAQFTVTIKMAAMKCRVDVAHNIKYSTLVTTMGRNGTTFGIRVSGLGDEWFVSPAPEVKGFFFPGYTREDAALDMGDSVATEVGGIGAFSLAAAPALAKYGATVGLGGTFEDAMNTTLRAYEITMAEDPRLQIPTLNFRGVPVGIDVLKVLEKGFCPEITTSIAHNKMNGAGKIGAGIAIAPMECFKKAFLRMVEKWGLK